jgi:hypothetical protein
VGRPDAILRDRLLTPYDWRRGARAKALEQALHNRIAGDFRNSPEATPTTAIYVDGRGTAARIAQSKTGRSLKTGRKPKGKK